MGVPVGVRAWPGPFGTGVAGLAGMVWVTGRAPVERGGSLGGNGGGAPPLGSGGGPPAPDSGGKTDDGPGSRSGSSPSMLTRRSENGSGSGAPTGVRH